MINRIANVIASIMTSVITYQLARAGDALVRRIVRPPRGEVLFVSDLILASALGAVMYVWLDLRATRARLSGLERARIIVDTQLALAAEIQRHLLPPVNAGANGVRWAGRLEPALRIGGDFYDVIPDDAEDLFVVGDVSGKGIPAALLQASAHTLLRTIAREITDPAELLTRISRQIYAENGGSSYLTCLLVRVDTRARTLTYVNAGHPAGLMIGASGRHLLSSGGPPAGLFADTAYESEVLSIEAGDLGVIVTDGITEAIEEDGVAAVDCFGRAIARIREPRTPERVCDALMGMARRGSGPRDVANWQDDRTVFAFLI